MIYVSHDGGTLWKKSALRLDAWLSVVDGAIYAVAADPLLQAGALARAYPGLARALRAQLHDQRVDADDVRAALAWPGRDALLKGSLGLVFRSADGGETWSRATDVPVAVRADVLRQWSWFPIEPDDNQAQERAVQVPQRRPSARQGEAPPRCLRPSRWSRTSPKRCSSPSSIRCGSSRGRTAGRSW